MPSGTYTLIINAPDLVTSSQQITVTAGQDKIIDLPPMMVLTQEKLDQAVMDERQRWDINGDNKITLEEAIHALQVVSGVRPH